MKGESRNPNNNSNDPTLNNIPSISIRTSTPAEIADCIESSNGIVLVQDLPECPFSAILHLLHNQDVTTRLNRACLALNEPEIYKAGTSFQSGSGGPSSAVSSSGSSSKGCDRKRSLDVNLERLERIATADPDLVNDPTLLEPLEFYGRFQHAVTSKIIPALAIIISAAGQHDDEDDDGFNGTKNLLEDDLAFSYRMIDYFVEEDSKNQEQHPMRSRGATSPTAANAGRTVTAASPRLAEHRDFGFLTLIQQSQPGIQVKLEEDEDGRGGGAIGRRPRHRRKMHAQSKWYNLPATPNGTAILMGGWCARLRSNGRFPALLHRVPATASSGRSPSQMQQQQQRTSAVLFCNPKHTTTRLDPAVRRPTEDQRYINGVTAATLQQKLVGAKTERAVNLWLRCDDVKSKSKQERTWMSWFLPSSSSTKAQNKYNIE